MFPSVIESFGIVLLEAMAAGAPLIVSDIAAFKEIVSDESTALFFQTGNANDLSKKMVRLAVGLKTEKANISKSVGSCSSIRLEKSNSTIFGSL